MPTLLKFFVSLQWTSGNPCTGVLLSRYEKSIFLARKVEFQAKKVIGISRDIYNNVKRHQEMATRKIKFPVVLRQNDNSYSNAYG